jgi:hypothetical protein
MAIESGVSMVVYVKSRGRAVAMFREVGSQPGCAVKVYDVV